MKYFWSLSIVLLCGKTVFGQAVVEYSVGTAGASAAGAGVQGAGKAVGGVFGALTQTIQKASTSTVITPATEKQTVTSVPAGPPVEIKPIDPAQVTMGLDRAELIKRCGDPVTLTSENKNSKFIETFSYNTTTHDVLEVKVMDGKVTSITPLSSKKRPQVAFVLN